MRYARADILHLDENILLLYNLFNFIPELLPVFEWWQAFAAIGQQPLNQVLFDIQQYVSFEII